MKKIIGIDLFCGIGGLTYGLKQSGIEIVAGVDNDISCKYSYEINNNAKFIHKDIKEVTKEDLLFYFRNDSYKLIAGCAPCQPYSLHQKKERQKHSKYGLIMELLRLVKEIKPEFVTMENVPQLKNDPLLVNFLEWFEHNNYDYKYDVIDISKFGAGQKRRRFVFVASKLGKVNISQGNNNSLTVKEVIGHLPEIEMGKAHNNDPLHVSSRLNEINLKRINASKPGGTWNDWPFDLLPNCYKKESGKSYEGVYGRLDPNKPAPTLTTQFTKYGSGRYGHYQQNRALSLREGALLQTFPSHYDFGINNNIPMTSITRHIGNAVPPLLGKIIGDVITDIVKE